MRAPLGVGFDPAKLRKATTKEFAIRFAFGGAITAITGLLAHAYGPLIGGLFLAFPAILPASVTLIHHNDSHQQAGIDALGAVAGSVGLLPFAVAIWFLATRLPAWLAIGIAALAWFLVAAAVWVIARSVHLHRQETSAS